MLDKTLIDELQISSEQVGVLLIDHGSRREESNQLLHQVAKLFQQETQYPIVEPAHMELAEPSIAEAFDRAVARGAKLVIAFPYFLSPGRHWKEDVPRLVAKAAERHPPEIRYLVAAPLGLHRLMCRIIEDRIRDCIRQCLLDDASPCDICGDTAICQIAESGGSPSEDDVYPQGLNS